MAMTSVITDDLDGSSSASTITFALEGNTYEIDLSKKNVTALEKLLRPYIEAARSSTSARRTSSTGPGRGRGRRTAAASKVDLGAVRDWAAKAGVAVADRGRISKSVLEQYEAAQQA
jgi:hypothetical protein